MKLHNSSLWKTIISSGEIVVNLSLISIIKMGQTRRMRISLHFYQDQEILSYQTRVYYGIIIRLILSY
jgi:hypothetical protein